MLTERVEQLTRRLVEKLSTVARCKVRTKYSIKESASDKAGKKPGRSRAR